MSWSLDYQYPEIICFFHVTPNCSAPLDVWKKLLDESEKIGKQHLAMSEALQTQIADNIKTLKASKAQTYKKVILYSLNQKLVRLPVTLNFYVAKCNVGTCLMVINHS